MANLEAVKAHLSELVWSSPRARLRALMPVIDRISRDGVTYALIAQELASSGLILKPHSVRQALYRWRKQSGTSSTDVAAPGALAGRLTAPAEANAPAGRLVAPPGPTSGQINGKADLVRLRKSSEPIDLDELAELGRRR